MMLVIFSEALGAGQTFADKHGYRLESSQEMIALGLANLGSGVLGGLACGGSLSQSAVNDGAGARTEMSPVIAAALIIHAVSHLMKVGEMRRFRRLAPREFWLAVLTLLGVIVLDVLPALILGVVIALLLLVYRASRPQISLLGADPVVPGAFADISRHDGITPVPGVLIVRPDAPLFYANAELVRDAIEQAVGSARAVVLVLDGNDNLDITSAEQLGKLASGLGARNVPLGLAHVHGPALEMAERSGLLASVGADRVFPTTPTAVAWAQSVAGTPAPGLGRPAGPGLDVPLTGRVAALRRPA